MNPTTYHWVNAALHGLVTFCLTTLIRPLIRHPLVRIFTGLAFAAHPVHCEAVASLVGRAELGAALHTLIALLAYRAHLSVRNSTPFIAAKEAHRLGRDKGAAIQSNSDLTRFIRRLTICCWCPDSRSDARPAEPHRRRRSVAPKDEGGVRSAALLAASLVAGSSAVLWKETGMAAVPLCALLELLDGRQSNVARQVIKAAPVSATGSRYKSVA